MSGEPKLQPHHLARKAVVYLRQSSGAQVLHNKESQHLQYGLVARARKLGFREVVVVDGDLGSSASVGARVREDFEKLLAMVALKEAGLILSREVSRLLRTDKDFCRLIELCQVFDTLVGDDHQLYDVNTLDDQLVLGIKGTLSVVELKILRMRLLEGIYSKAGRGELYRLLPPGYVFDGARKPVKDPDLRVRETIELVFKKFRETGTIRQTLKWFRDNDVEVPTNKVRGGKFKVVFQLPTQSLVSEVLHNPFYAGAYVYGRRPVRTVWEGGLLRKRQGALLPLSEVRVFLRDHHEGYIDWPSYEENQQMIRRNVSRSESDSSVGAVRAGQGLLCGLLRCGRCGRKIYVRYWGKAGSSARYLCSGSFEAGGTYCLGFGGRAVDRRFAEELLRAISPLGVRAGVEAAARMGTEDDARKKALERQLEQLEYEACRAFEQYDEVDPRRRLVADELERRWNEKLSELENARAALAELLNHRPRVSDEEREQVLALGERFEEVWNSPACPVELKKKMVRAVVEEVVANEESEGRLKFVVHWKGGTHTVFEMDRPRAAPRTAADDIEVIRKMAERYGDNDIAAVLNRLGRRTGKGRRWSQLAVKTARRNYGIAGHTRTVEDPEVLSFTSAARYLGVSNTTVVRLAEAGVLPVKQVVPYAPWEVRRATLNSEPVRSVVARLKATGRLHLEVDSSVQQRKLFE
jgi:DNA invertase Pin-like site-specific DNA recombinase